MIETHGFDTMGYLEARRTSAMKRLLELEPEDHSSVTFEEDCRRADGEVIRAKIDASLLAVEGTAVDHMLTIEELSDAGGGS